ncbi:uncharacterized protein BXZ73DRAFT_98870 [Epithele typhae]|uniref:uncharacterized protein n=1 Tax=Epithele typhae TaxID=378194 RepID=UPI002008977F|nr:uncharacterized protein BXZ73DRAFT_98870 [Epithele typhae]KAH9940436.1 hypothetical protein BXZ73DRAFT_98870 [Epithele typhae]
MPDTVVTMGDAVDVGTVQEFIGTMRATYRTLDATFSTLHDQSARISELGPTTEAVDAEVVLLRDQLSAHQRAQTERVDAIKYILKNDVKRQAAETLKSQIHESIRLEIEREVKRQVDDQIGEHIPVPLPQQREDFQMEIADVRRALDNAEARRHNATIRPSPDSLKDDLAVVFKPDGSRSKLYPANLNSLFAYSALQARQLLRDFELHDDGMLERNLNRFMSHIGIRFELVPVPPTPGGSASAGNITLVDVVPSLLLSPSNIWTLIW